MNKKTISCILLSLVMAAVAPGAAAQIARSARGGDRAEKKDKNRLEFYACFATPGLGAAALGVDLARESHELAGQYIDAFVQNICEKSGQIARDRKAGKGAAAVRRVIGAWADSRFYCVAGLYASNRDAEAETGLGLGLIPDSAKNSCHMFKTLMSARYASAEYVDCFHSGDFWRDPEQYQAALDKFASDGIAKFRAAFARKNKRDPDECELADELEKLGRRFRAGNFHTGQISPGAILIEPSARNSATGWHATAYLGRGEFSNADGKFAHDARASHKKGGFNNDGIFDVFGNRPVLRGMFAADIREIASILLEKKAAEIAGMDKASLVEYLAGAAGAPADAAERLAALNAAILRNIALGEYFGKDFMLFKITPPPFSLEMQRAARTM